MFSVQSEPASAAMYCSNVPREMFLHFLCPHSDVCCLKTLFGKLPKSRCMNGISCTHREFVPTTRGNSFHCGHQ